jgi:Transcriptional regulators
VLQAEEWVQRHGSHFMVTPLSLERIKQITEIRSILEVESNLLALRRMDEATRRSFDSLRVRINGLDSSATNLDIVNADLALHRRLYAATRNTQLTKVLDPSAEPLSALLAVPAAADRAGFVLRRHPGDDRRGGEQRREGPAGTLRTPRRPFRGLHRADIPGLGRPPGVGKAEPQGPRSGGCGAAFFLQGGPCG